MVTYDLVFNKGRDKGVYAISVVENPAMESNFITLSKDKGFNEVDIKLSEVDPVKYILAGVVLVPDREVYRNQGGKEFNIRCSQDFIFNVANEFIQQGYQGNSSLEHDKKLEGVSIVQSWVVNDDTMDTALSYGLPKEDIKKGSWVVLYKCDNKEVYNKAINGEIKGFSIDGLFSLEEVNLKTEVKMTKEDLIKFKDELLSDFKAAFTNEKPTEEVAVKLGVAVLKDGETQIEYTGETPEAGADVFVVNGDERAPLPAGDYPLEDGSVLVVVEDGKIDSIKPMEEEAPNEDAPAELNNTPTQGDIEQMIKSVLVKYKSESDKETEVLLAKQKKELEVKLSDQAKEIEELKKTPAAVALSSAPAQVKLYKDMTNFEKLKYNEQNR